MKRSLRNRDRPLGMGCAEAVAETIADLDRCSLVGEWLLRDEVIGVWTALRDGNALSHVAQAATAEEMMDALVRLPGVISKRARIASDARWTMAVRRLARSVAATGKPMPEKATFVLIPAIYSRAVMLDADQANALLPSLGPGVAVDDGATADVLTALGVAPVVTSEAPSKRADATWASEAPEKSADAKWASEAPSKRADATWASEAPSKSIVPIKSRKRAPVIDGQLMMELAA